MNIYFAPLEGITGYIFRNIFNEVFPGVEEYFAPFIVANKTYKFKNRELLDINPENNKNITLIPQLLANKSEEFNFYAKEINERFGYKEINLNLGCPMSTVVSKHRGCGMLEDLYELDCFLSDIFDFADKNNYEISIKTRLGLDDFEDIDELMGIYNKYKMSRLIVHPRNRKDMYKNSVNINAFKSVYELSRNELIYNGDILTLDDFENVEANFPQVKGIMIGRGFLINPTLVDDIKGNSLSYEEKIEKIKKFHDLYYTTIKEKMSPDAPILFKMKEFWHYLKNYFDEDKYKKQFKQIKKCKKCSDYEETVKSIWG
ncbi:tRNA-dihydrouridine synthase [Acetitomaculum ruminis DSM 5522]|uniref:tRNA-dihydrouridine synthase n=1 Tax=Acetitomaculum ruminis DSM 5522 TaxID=1120918 RepID=A0A1I0ZBL1_9FIRM|nr:tRNA-dihydrouridine synthase family protein [Acetitomaculum ruminis]SFB22747.1 tRNA-dihydrouridine synthase [Acetitomaculum ruminis DSM 5522]